MAKKKEADRLDRGAWVDAAMKLLEVGSIDSVRIEPIAKALGVTKGSFYWHFEDRDGLRDAILDTWRKRATVNIINRLEQEGESTEETIRHVLSLSWASRHSESGAAIEFAIRDWAKRDKKVARTVEEIDEQRLRFNERLFRKLGMPEEWVKARAFLVNSFNLGDAMMRKVHNAQEREMVRRLCVDFLSQPHVPASKSD